MNLPVADPWDTDTLEKHILAHYVITKSGHSICAICCSSVIRSNALTHFQDKHVRRKAVCQEPGCHQVFDSIPKTLRHFTEQHGNQSSYGGARGRGSGVGGGFSLDHGGQDGKGRVGRGTGGAPISIKQEPPFFPTDADPLSIKQEPPFFPTDAAPLSIKQEPPFFPTDAAPPGHGSTPLDNDSRSLAETVHYGTEPGHFETMNHKHSHELRSE